MNSKLCGFRPTGKLHLGHYLSVIEPGQQGSTVLVANYHAPEVKQIDLAVNVLKRYGVQNIVLQTDVFNPELF